MIAGARSRSGAGASTDPDPRARMTCHRAEQENRTWPYRIAMPISQPTNLAPFGGGGLISALIKIFSNIPPFPEYFSGT